MKKIIYSIIVLVLFILSILVVIFIPGEKDVNKIKESEVIAEESKHLMEYDIYKEIKIEDIDYIEKITYTEGGSDKEVIRSRENIKSTYNYLNKFKVGEETKISCDDNTINYNFYMKNKKFYRIQITCGDILDHNNYNHYKLR